MTRMKGGNEADEGFDDLAVHGISSGWVTLREGAAGGTLMLGIRGVECCDSTASGIYGNPQAPSS